MAETRASTEKHFLQNVYKFSGLCCSFAHLNIKDLRLFYVMES
jgi:hypothetical protein